MARDEEEPEEQSDDGEEDEVSLDKDIVFVVKLHESLVGEFDISPVSITMRKDPDLGFSDSEFVMEYDLGYGDMLLVSCKREGGNMLVSLTSSGKESDHAVPIDQYVDDDFMPVADEEFSRLIQDWFE